MPKVHDTRKQKARELLRMAKDGPSFSGPKFVGEEFTVEEATRQYRRWANSWVVPLLEGLVPELKKKQGGDHVSGKTEI